VRFLPSLRRSPSSKTLQTAALENEVKALRSAYYQSLWRHEAGIRARYWPVERAVVEGYERIVWVFKAVQTIGADHARLPFRLRQDGQMVDDHPLYRVLNKKANPLETGQVFRKRLSAQILLSKQGAFVEKTYSNGGTVKRLDLLPPDRVEIMPATGDKADRGELVDHFRLQRIDGGYREIDPKNVLWFRDPHPLDPYSGVTPLEAAGMSVELDYFARLYNVSFMRNDGRPGGVLAVRHPDGTSGNIDPRQMDRVESKFQKGPGAAGALAVVEGQLEYIDLAAKPREMAYGDTSKNSKVELLSSFGVPETVLAYAADRTFSNASDELYVYWTITMQQHNEIIVSGFDEDSEDDLEGYLDTSKVEVLQRAEIARREEARAEVEKGLRSIKSYADLAGYGDEIDDTVHTRALYIPQGRTPLPSKAEDADDLGLDQPTQEAQPEQPALPAGPGTGDVAAGPAAGPASPGETTSRTPEPPAAATTAGAAAAALAAAAAPGPGAKRLTVVPGEAKRATPPRGRVVLRVTRPAPVRDDVVESEADERSRDRLEDTLAAALTALSTRWFERTIARLESPKSRKGTRHWAPDGPSDTRGGTKALDSAKAVDEERWSGEAETGTEPIVKAAAIAAAVALLTDLGEDAEESAVAGMVAGAVASVVALIAGAAASAAERLARVINEADQDGLSLNDIVAQIRDQSARFITVWSERVATQAATATVNGAREAAAVAAEAATGDDITRTWLTRRDDRVRHTHHEADGQQQPLGTPFVVGQALLRYPGDPLGPAEEVINCRCRLLHRSKRSGRFVTPPAEAAS
jgi:HK97 family phage portal protein